MHVQIMTDLVSIAGHGRDFSASKCF